MPITLDLPHDGDTAWGNKITTAFNTVTTAVDGKADTNHPHPNLQSQIDGKSDIGHLHPELQAQITENTQNQDNITNELTQLRDLLNYFLPDLAQLTYSLSVASAVGGLRFVCGVAPMVHINAWDVHVYRRFKLNPKGIHVSVNNVDGSSYEPVYLDWAEIYQNEYTSSSFLIPYAEITSWGASDGDLLQIRVRAKSGQNYSEYQTTNVTLCLLNVRYTENDVETEGESESHSSAKGGYVKSLEQEVYDAIETFINEKPTQQAIANCLATSPDIQQTVYDAFSTDENIATVVLNVIAEQTSWSHIHQNLLDSISGIDSRVTQNTSDIELVDANQHDDAQNIIGLNLWKDAINSHIDDIDTSIDDINTAIGYANNSLSYAQYDILAQQNVLEQMSWHDAHIRNTYTQDFLMETWRVYIVNYLTYLRNWVNAIQPNVTNPPTPPTHTPNYPIPYNPEKT